MFWFFKTADKIEKIDRATSRSFAKVRADIDALSSWVSYLYDENYRLKQKVENLQHIVGSQALEINDLKVDFKNIPKTPSELKKSVESVCDFDRLFRRLRLIEEKIDVLETKAHHVSRPVVHSVSHVPSKPASSSALKDKLMRRLARNSKEYIKNVILGLVNKYGKMTALQLRDIVVDEQGLCSKSSFYRILEEMEIEKVIAPVHEGKKKIFIPAS